MAINFIPYGPVEVENVHNAKIYDNVPLIEFVKKVSMTIGPMPAGIAVGQNLTLQYNTDDNCYMTTHNGNLFRCMNPRFRAVQS